MRIAIALFIFVLQTSLLAAEPMPEPKAATGDSVRFEATANIFEPSEFEIELTGELFLAPAGIKIVATNTLTNEEIWIVINHESSEITFLFPDTLNGVSKVVADSSPIWALLNAGFNKSALANFTDADGQQIDEIKIRKTTYPGTRYQTNNGGYTDVWWNLEGKPKRIVLHTDSNNAQLDFFEFEYGVELPEELLTVGKEFSIRQAEPDESLNPFQL